MKQLFFGFIFMFLTSINLHSQSYNGLDHTINVSYDISADQYMNIKLFVLKNGGLASFNDIDANVVHYSFTDTDIYVLPCNLDPMEQVDSIMAEYNYCQLVFKIKFGTPLYSSFIQYMSLKLINNEVLLEPIYNDPDPEYTIKREDLINIVQSVTSQIESID